MIIREDEFLVFSRGRWGDGWADLTLPCPQAIE